MTRAQIAAKISEATGLSKRETEIVVEGFISCVIDALRENETIEIRGFGTFKNNEKEPRIARNPKTGENAQIKFTLNKNATYYVDILKSGVIVDNVTPASGKNASSDGEYAETWDGRNLSGNYVAEGSYLVRVKAKNSVGWADPDYTIVYVDYPAIITSPVPGAAPATTPAAASAASA